MGRFVGNKSNSAVDACDPGGPAGGRPGGNSVLIVDGKGRVRGNGIQAFNLAPGAFGEMLGEAVFGRGSDGSLVWDNTSTVLGIAPSGSPLGYTLFRDISCENMTVNSGVVIRTNGYKIFVRSVLTLLGSAIIQNDGNAGGAGATMQTGGAAGSATSPGTLGAGQAGGIGGTGGAVNTNGGAGNSGTQANPSKGGAGGTGGNGKDASPRTGGAGRGASITPTRAAIDNVFTAISQLEVATLIQGGSGGGSGGGGAGAPSIGVGAGGGGGGSGGGVILLVANTVDFSGWTSGRISVDGGNGGNGGNGQTGGGGGGGGSTGGGGFLTLILRNYLGAFPQINAAIGSGVQSISAQSGLTFGSLGSGGTGGTVATRGSNGTVLIFNLSSRNITTDARLAATTSTLNAADPDFSDDEEAELGADMQMTFRRAN